MMMSLIRIEEYRAVRIFTGRKKFICCVQNDPGTVVSARSTKMNAAHPCLQGA